MGLQMRLDVRDATGLTPPPWPRTCPDRNITDAAIGTLDERQAFGGAHGYDVDVVVGASYEFRRTVCAHTTVVGRGEAQHVLRALLAAGWTPPDVPCRDCGRPETVTPDDRLCDVCAADRYERALSDIASTPVASPPDPPAMAEMRAVAAAALTPINQTGARDGLH